MKLIWEVLEIFNCSSSNQNKLYQKLFYLYNLDSERVNTFLQTILAMDKEYIDAEYKGVKYRAKKYCITLNGFENLLYERFKIELTGYLTREKAKAYLNKK